MACRRPFTLTRPFAAYLLTEMVLFGVHLASEPFDEPGQNELLAALLLRGAAIVALGIGLLEIHAESGVTKKLEKEEISLDGSG